MTELANFEKALAEFKRILEEAETEKPIQEFLENHPYFLPHPAAHVARNVVIAQFTLGGDRIPDFAYLVSNSASCFLYLIELESPRQQIFVGSDDFSARYNKSLQQPLDWLEWCEAPENLAFLRNQIGPLLEATLRPERLSVMSVFISGRRAMCMNNTTRKCRYSRLVEQHYPFVQIMTYDRFLERMPMCSSRGGSIRCTHFKNQNAFAARLNEFDRLANP